MYFPFLDEAPEFSGKLIEALRTPLEQGSILIGRAAAQVRYPANFQLVLSANPCPCGYAGVAGKGCTCPPMTVRRYLGRLSGPILDRIDLHHRVSGLPRSVIAYEEAGEKSAVVAGRVLLARDRQAHRLLGTPWRTNAEVSGTYLRTSLPLPDGIEILDQAVAHGRLSSRGVDKVLRIAWTIADLDGDRRPTRAHLHTALAMRRGETLGDAA